MNHVRAMAALTVGGSAAGSGRGRGFLVVWIWVSYTRQVRQTERSGLADYLAISKPSQSLDIHSIVLEPGPVNLAAKKR